MYCTKCGAQIDDSAIACPKCGAPTKNYKPRPAAQPQTTVNVSSRQAQPSSSAFSESWKFAVGILILLLGASAFLQSWRDWSWVSLAVSIVAILGGAMLLAWGIVGVKAAAHPSKSEDKEIHV